MIRLSSRNLKMSTNAREGMSCFHLKSTTQELDHSLAWSERSSIDLRFSGVDSRKWWSSADRFFDREAIHYEHCRKLEPSAVLGSCLVNRDLAFSDKVCCLIKMRVQTEKASYF